MNVTEELLDLKSLKGQTRGTDLFVSVCEAVDDMKLPWSKVSGIITDGAPAMAGERSGLSTLICNKVSEEAAMDSPAPEGDFSCAICLELFKVPLSLSCGHSFCKSCIESHWAVQTEETGFSCPECRRVYYRKPELSKNVFIANMMEMLTEIPISPRAGTNSPRAGTNSPRVAINSPRGGRRCEPHGQGLELYCRTDAQLICPGCTSCHRRHDIVPVQEEQEDKSEELSSMKLRLSKREGSEISLVNGLVDSTKTVEAAAGQIKWRLSSSYDKLLHLLSEDKASALRAVDKERDLKLSGIRQEIEKSRATLGNLREALSRIRSLEETEDPVEFLEVLPCA